MGENRYMSVLVSTLLFLIMGLLTDGAVIKSYGSDHLRIMMQPSHLAFYVLSCTPYPVVKSEWMSIKLPWQEWGAQDR